MFKKYRYLLFFIILISLFFWSRFSSHLQYDALEDEILAIDNNLIHSPSEQLFAPDFTHPPLWYLLMEYPTEILGLSHGIFYYRLLQVLILFVSLIFIIVYFWKKIPHKFIFLFLSLFLTNIALVHLTAQHRMYALVLSLGIFYSFYWYYLLFYKTQHSWKDFFSVGVIAALGFFSNYSMIWLIPIFPIAYLLLKKSKIALKNISTFMITFLSLISWFIPTFIENSRTSIVENQWTGEFNFYNIFQLFANYFGIIPIREEIGYLSPFAIFFVIVLLLIIFGEILIKKNKAVSILFLSSLISFSFFLIVVYLTGNSLLYPRTAIAWVLSFYIIFAHIGKFKYLRILVIVLTLLQLSQFILYFNQNRSYSEDYFFVDYRFHPIKYFTNYNFDKQSCLIPIPAWNVAATTYFLNNKIKTISPELLMNIDSNESLIPKECQIIYVLEQFSLEKNKLKKQYQDFFPDNFKLELVDTNENQNLYLLTLL